MRSSRLRHGRVGVATKQPVLDDVPEGAFSAPEGLSRTAPGSRPRARVRPPAACPPPTPRPQLDWTFGRPLGRPRAHRGPDRPDRPRRGGPAADRASDPGGAAPRLGSSSPTGVTRGATCACSSPRPGSCSSAWWSSGRWGWPFSGARCRAGGRACCVLAAWSSCCCWSAGWSGRPSRGPCLRGSRARDRRG